MKSVKVESAPSELAQGAVAVRSRPSSKPAQRLLWFLLLLVIVLAIRQNDLGGSLGDRVQTFVTIFLSIFIEAAPFLLAGSIVSGFIEVFVERELLYRFVPRQPFLPAWSPDGRYLAFQSFPLKELGATPSLWLLELQTGRRQQLVAGSRPTWLP